MTGQAPVVRELASGVGFSEGPVVTPDGDILVTSIDHGRVYRVKDGGAEVFAETGGGANGAVLDGAGNLFIAQNGGRWAGQGPSWNPDSVGGVQRISPDGTVTWVTREPLAPNDLCFGPDGLLYVTDPTRAPRNRVRPVDGRIWRVNPVNGATELLLSVPWFTNGIAFGPDDRLYVAATHTATIYRYEVTGDGLVNECAAIRMRAGGPDGMAFDAAGNLVIGAIAMPEPAVLAGEAPGQDRSPRRGTIQTWSADGEPLAEFEPGPGAMYTNVAFDAGNGLVITDSSNGKVLLAEGWPARGLPLHPFR